MPLALASQVGASQATQLRFDKGQQGLEGLIIAAGPCPKQLRDAAGVLNRHF
jgi:hypothetical protein